MKDGKRQTWPGVLGKEVRLQAGMMLDAEGVFARLEERGCFEAQKGPGAQGWLGSPSQGWQGAGTALGTEGDKAGPATGCEGHKSSGRKLCPTEAWSSAKI